MNGISTGHSSIFSPYSVRNMVGRFEIGMGEKHIHITNNVKADATGFYKRLVRDEPGEAKVVAHQLFEPRSTQSTICITLKPAGSKVKRQETAGEKSSGAGDVVVSVKAGKVHDTSLL